MSWVAFESLWALASVSSSFTVASSIKSAGAGLTEVEDSTAGVRISFGSRRTLADISSILVDALRSGATWVAQTLVQVDTPSVRVSSVSLLAGACVVAGVVVTQRVCSAGF